MNTVLDELQTLNRDLFFTKGNYLFVGEYKKKRYIITNIERKKLHLSETVEDYEIISREEFHRL